MVCKVIFMAEGVLLRASSAFVDKGPAEIATGALSYLSSPSQWGWGRGGCGNAQGISGDNRLLAVTGYAQALGSESKHRAAETLPWRHGGREPILCLLVVELWKTLILVSRNGRRLATDPSTSLGGFGSPARKRMWG